MWLSGLRAGLRTRGSLVGFPVRAHAWVVGQVPTGACARGNHTLMFLSLSFSLPFPLSNNKIFLKEKRKKKINTTLPYKISVFSCLSKLLKEIRKIKVIKDYFIASNANKRLIQIMMQDFYYSKGPVSLSLRLGSKRDVIILTGSSISFILTMNILPSRKRLLPPSLYR